MSTNCRCATLKRPGQLLPRRRGSEGRETEKNSPLETTRKAGGGTLAPPLSASICVLWRFKLKCKKRKRLKGREEERRAEESDKG